MTDGIGIASSWPGNAANGLVISTRLTILDDRSILQKPLAAPSHPLEAVVITLLLTSFVAATYGFGTYLFAQLVTDMRADLGFGYTVAGTMTAAGQFGFLAFAIGGTWLTPRVGGSQVVIGSVVLCGAALALLATTNNILLVGMTPSLRYDLSTQPTGQRGGSRLLPL